MAVLTSPAVTKAHEEPLATAVLAPGVAAGVGVVEDPVDDMVGLDAANTAGRVDVAWGVELLLHAASNNPEQTAAAVLRE